MRAHLSSARPACAPRRHALTSCHGVLEKRRNKQMRICTTIAAGNAPGGGIGVVGFVNLEARDLRKVLSGRFRRRVV
jgi:hypothetical protein